MKPNDFFIRIRPGQRFASSVFCFVSLGFSVFYVSYYKVTDEVTDEVTDVSSYREPVYVAPP